MKSLAKVFLLAIGLVVVIFVIGALTNAHPTKPKFVQEAEQQQAAKTFRCKVPYSVEYCKAHQFEMRNERVWSEK